MPDQPSQPSQPSQPPPQSPPARQTLLAARDGDHEAGRQLVERFGPSMVRTAWSVLGRYGGTEADDVVQEALISALTTTALPTGDVGAWLRAITVRKALDRLRASERRRETSIDEPPASTRPGGRSDRGEPSAGREPPDPRSPRAVIDVMAVRQGLSKLSAMDRAVLVLADVEGRSMAEIAETLGSTRVAVRLRASRARRKLARIMAPVTAGARTGAKR